LTRPAFQSFTLTLTPGSRLGAHERAAQLVPAEQADFVVRAQIVWAKDRLALSRGDYHWQHELCWCAVRDGGTGHRTDDRTQSTLWTIPAPDDDGHGTQNPVESMRRRCRVTSPAFTGRLRQDRGWRSSIEDRGFIFCEALV
jgi:hypothetical protein